MSFSFKQLTLKGVQASTAGAALPPGRYVAKVIEATLKKTKDQTGTRLELKFKEVNGKGGIMAWLNLHLPGKEKATEIGLEQLKALLVHGGHPDPDEIGDHGMESIKGLTVGIVVGKDSQDANRTEVKGFIDPKTVPGFTSEGDGPIGGDSEIPF